MIKKKKITKQSLAELAKVMPTLHECEMRAMVGGIEFRDLSGNLIKQVGYTSEVRYIDPMNSSTMDAINSIESSPNADNVASSIGRSWDNIGSAAKVSLISSMIGEGGSRYAKLSTQSVSFGKPQNNDAVMGVANNIGLVINMSQSRNFTYAELQSILDHEEIHLVANASGTGLVVSKDENAAYSGQVSNSAFESTSYWFKVLTARSWHGQSGNFTKREIAEACGVREEDL